MHVDSFRIMMFSFKLQSSLYLLEEQKELVAHGNKFEYVPCLNWNVIIRDTTRDSVSIGPESGKPIQQSPELQHS